MKKVLIVEGNTKENNLELVSNNIETHTQSIHNSLNKINENLKIEEFNPSIKNNLDKLNLEKYDGLIWSGGNGHIYENDDDTMAQIEFMKICFKKVKNIFAICWGMQVAVTASGGAVKKGVNGSHIGIANSIKLTYEGLNHRFYEKKSKEFNSPAFNFDEVTTVPSGAIHLASNEVNKIQGLQFNSGISEVWGLQYHPEITYEKMISIIKFRKNRLINDRKRFKDEDEIENHVNSIEKEIEVSDKESRMIELKNWLNSLIN